MGGGSDTSFKVAAGIFGVVVCALLAIGVAKVALSGGLDAALRDGGFGYGDDYEECADFFASMSPYDENPDVVSSSYDMHRETAADGSSRSWSLSAQVFRDPVAAARMVEQEREFTSDEDFEKCMALGEESSSVELLEPAVSGDGVVGWAMVVDYDGEEGRTDTITWAEGSLVATLEVWGPASSGASDRVREQYDSARVAVKEQAKR